MLNVVLALLAGMVTVAAPCTLPMLPILLGASVGQTSRARPAMIALGFVISFSATALLLNAIIDIFDLDPNILRTGATILLLGFGLLMIWPTPFEWLSIRPSGLMNGSSAGNATSRQAVRANRPHHCAAAERQQLSGPANWAVPSSGPAW
jgi:cytochrome c-type biogenesis protein